MKKYWYCGIRIKGMQAVYSYISDMGEFACGTYVRVEFGKDNALRIGIVTSCEKYNEDCVPFPVEKTKHIIDTATKD